VGDGCTHPRRVPAMKKRALEHSPSGPYVTAGYIRRSASVQHAGGIFGVNTPNAINDRVGVRRVGELARDRREHVGRDNEPKGAYPVSLAVTEVTPPKSNRPDGALLNLAMMDGLPFGCVMHTSREAASRSVF
jgi:hypothetical protein